MPLIQGKSKESFQHNLKAEQNAGKPMKQSLAIAYNVMRKNRAKKMADGGLVLDKKTGGAKHMTKEDLDKQIEETGGLNPDDTFYDENTDTPGAMRAAEGGMAGDDSGMGSEPVPMGARRSRIPREDMPYEALARGGMADPHKIMRSIMMKHLAEGGMTDDCYAVGGQVPDDSDPEIESTESFDSVPIEELGYDSEREDTEGMSQDNWRRGALLKIMRSLHREHKGS